MVLGIDKGKLIDQAQRYIQRGQTDKAILEYQKIVDADSKDLRMRIKLGELHLKRGNKQAAIDEYSKAAESYTSDGFNLQAMAVYKQILKIDPSLYDVYIKLADLYRKQGLIADALAQYRMLITNYEREGRMGEAVDTLKRMASLDPENLSIMAKLADLLFKSGSRKDALDEYLKIANGLSSKGRMDDVIAIYEKALSIDPSCIDAHRGLGEAYIRTGRSQEAFFNLQAAVDMDPNDVRTLFLLAETYMEINEPASAKLAYEHILRIDPSSLEAMKGISKIFIKEGDYEAGIRAVMPAVDGALAENNPANALGILFEFYRNDIREPLILEKMVQAYTRKGEEEKAKEIRGELADAYEARGEIAKAEDIRKGPDVSEGEGAHIGGAPAEDISRYLTEAEVYVKYGLKDKAIEALKTALSIDGTNRKAIEMLNLLRGTPIEHPIPKVGEYLDEAEFYIQQGLYDEARKICIRILQSHPENEEALLKLKAIDEAREARSRPSMPSAERSTERGFFDLAAELENEVGETVTRLPGIKEAERFEFEDVFSEFKKGVEAQVGEEDTETHYNLGIAYKEMGLLDDAVKEFEIALSDPKKEFDCYNLIGACYMEKGEFQEAVDVLKKGLELRGRSGSEYASMNYELGRAYERIGMLSEALAAYREASRRSPGFRDVESKIASLGV